MFILAFFKSAWIAAGVIGALGVSCVCYGTTKWHLRNRRRRQRNRRQSRAVLPNNEEVTTIHDYRLPGYSFFAYPNNRRNPHFVTFKEAIPLNPLLPAPEASPPVIDFTFFLVL